MEFSELPEFARDLKRLKKKYPSLDEDIKHFKKVLRVRPEGVGGKHWNCVHRDDEGGVMIFKVRLACAYLKADRMRVIYAYHRGGNGGIVFVEIYFKGDQVNEDRERIKRYLSGM
jgi:hypothetical protein